MTQRWKVFALFPLFVLAPYMCPAQKATVYRLSGDIAGTHDPSIIKEGKTWYVFATGKAPGRLPANWQAVEAPFLLRHGDYFYLFTSWDLCCRALKSTYKTMVRRSKSITGPYGDADGRE